MQNGVSWNLVTNKTIASRLFKLAGIAFAFFLVAPAVAAQELDSPTASLALGAPAFLEAVARIAATDPLFPEFEASSFVLQADEQNSTASSETTAPQEDRSSKPPPEPKRILGIMPNFRAVSAGVTPPPPTPKQSFIIATKNSFDYSAFVFVGITSLLAEADNDHPQLRKGIGGYGRYYWRGFADKTDGNYWVIFVLPSIFHEDERYYALGKGGLWKRSFYSASRIFVTPNYHGHTTVNISELLGRAISQAISLSYYPSETRTPGALASKYGFAIGRDMLTDVFREFWPDISVHVLHRQP